MARQVRARKPWRVDRRASTCRRRARRASRSAVPSDGATAGSVPGSRRPVATSAHRSLWGYQQSAVRSTSADSSFVRSARSPGLAKRRLSAPKRGAAPETRAIADPKTARPCRRPSIGCGRVCRRSSPPNAWPSTGRPRENSGACGSGPSSSRSGRTARTPGRRSIRATRASPARMTTCSSLALAQRLRQCVAFNPTEWYAFSDHGPIVATFED